MFRCALYVVFALASILNSHHLLAQDRTFGGANKRETSARPTLASASSNAASSNAASSNAASSNAASSNAASSNARASADRVAGSQHLLAPIAEDEQFFSPPDNNKTVPTAAKGPSTDSKRPQIRLLGVGRVGKHETDETHAILRMADQQLYGRIGDSFGEIEVVDIGRRSVTLQSGRERWTIELFKQPLVNTTSEAKSPSATNRRNSTQQSRRSSVTSSAPKLVSIEPTMPAPQLPSGSPVDPALGVPELPDLELPPPAPDLPDFSNIR